MISSSRGWGTTAPPPPGTLRGVTPLLALCWPHREAGTSQERLLPLSPPRYLTPCSPLPSPCPQPLPLAVLTRPRQDKDLFIRQALLPGELGEPLQALGTELLRPACSQEQGERQPPPLHPSVRGHAALGHGQPIKGQVPQEGGPDPAIPWVTPAWEMLLPFFHRRDPPQSTSQGVPGWWWGGWHRGAGADVL